MQLRVDTSELVKLEKGLMQLSVAIRDKVVMRSTNATGGTTRTLIKGTLAKETSLPPARVLRRFKTFKAHPKNATFRITIKDNHVRLIEFGGRQLRGSTTSAKVWGKRQQFKDTFIATMGNGRQGIFKHQRGRTASGNQKIKMLYGPALPKELMRGDSGMLMRKHIHTKWPINVKRFMKFEITTVKAKYKL